MIRFLKDWALIIAILSGIVGYFAYVNIPFLDGTHALANQTVAVVQPLLLFCMLFLTFCRINPKHLRLCGWHGWLLLFQGLCFTLPGICLLIYPENEYRVEIEGAMLCLICPTATAAPVIVRKLGGNVGNITTYTILINLLVAMLIPAMAPLVHPNPGVNFFTSAAIIMAKVFPLLLLPLVAAMLIRRLSPRLHFRLSHLADLSFYLWAFALCLAIVVSTRSIVHSTVGTETMVWLVVISLLSCIVQFWFGRNIGAKYGDMITAGQALGQKNTVLIIWMGYTFFTPVTSIVGGFYSIWHNVFNSWQIYKARKKK